MVGGKAGDCKKLKFGKKAPKGLLPSVKTISGIEAWHFYSFSLKEGHQPMLLYNCSWVSVYLVWTVYFADLCRCRQIGSSIGSLLSSWSNAELWLRARWFQSVLEETQIWTSGILLRARLHILALWDMSVLLSIFIYISNEHQRDWLILLFV